MTARSWLSTCSSPAAAAAASPENSLSTASCSDNHSSFSSTSNRSIQTNLSLLTLPSVPSLQKINLSAESAAIPHFTTSLKPPRPLAHVNFLKIHNNLLYAAVGNQINVYDIVKSITLFDTLKVVKDSTASVKSIAFCDCKIFTCHQDSKIRIWELNCLHKHHKLIATLPTLKDCLQKCMFPHNYVRVRRHKKRLWIKHNDTVSGLASDGKIVLSISWDKSLKIWHAQNFKCLASINKAHDDAINAVAISKEGLIYTCSADKTIKVWKKNEETNIRNYRLFATLDKHKSSVNALALNIDDSILFSGSCDRSVLVWEREDSANHMVATGALRGHVKAVLCLINVQDLLFSGSADRTVRIWQRGVDGRYCCLSVLDGHQTPVKSLAAVAVDGGVKVF